MRTLLLFLCVTSSALAFRYSGTVTQVVTETNDSTYHVGQSWTTSFWYDSEQMDGTYYLELTDSMFIPPGANHSGHVRLDLTHPSSYDGYEVQNGPGEGFGGIHDLDGPLPAYFTVSGGVVTDFSYLREMGQFVIQADENVFWTTLTGRYSLESQQYLDQLYTSGTLEFGAPVQQVPEVPWTLGLVVLGFLGLAGTRMVLSPVRN